MRPLELRLSGFRSYRTERSISFRDLDLIAIIGDTGAGKSTLLEAMTWALYGASTWSKKSSSELLAHGAKRMSVALEFEAAGEQWLVTRTFGRSSAGGAELECLSNPSIARVDGVRQVDPEIERLLGLSYDVFCSCVLLPQGKFERLLKATKGERTDTLKSILRLEQLEDARALAERHAGIVAERERELLDARIRFREDPAGDAVRAEAEIAAVVPERARLVGVAERAAALVENCREQAEQAQSATAEADRLDSQRRDWAKELRDLTAHAREIEESLSTARQAAEAAKDVRADLDTEHREAVEAGLDRAALSRQQERVTTALSALKRLLTTRARVEEDQRAASAAAKVVAEARGALEEADRVLADHDSAIRAARERAENAKQHHEAIESAKNALTEALAEEDTARSQLDEAKGTASTAQERHAGAVAAGARARDSHDRALADREGVRVELAAAHAAARCEPGDPCPVCARPLPGNFVPTRAPDLDTADQAVADALAELRAAEDIERTAAVDARAATDRLATAEGIARSAANKSSAAREAVRALLQLQSDDDEAVAIAKAAGAASDDADTAERELAELASSRAPIETSRNEDAKTLSQSEADLRARERGLAERREDLVSARRELEHLVSALPAFCALGADTDAIDEALLLEAERAVASRLTDAADLERRRDKAVRASEDKASEVQAGELKLEREILGPVRNVRDMLRAVARELPVEMRDGLQQPGDRASPAELMPFAEAVESSIRDRIAALRNSAAEATAAERHAAAESRKLIDKTGFTDSAALASRLDEVRATILAAEREHRAAQDQIAGAQRLDELIQRAREMHAGFKALKDALADRAFVGYVVARRQRALLVYASKVLEEITGRYAFTEDFQILDGESGLARSPDTLSGGETFIASLALALGLVEVADRSGGDLRALFLDEGFGSLDAAILDTALTALEERAKAGRLIGLISHVPTIAERIETVLEVRNGIDGSTIDLLSQAQRDARVLDGVASAAASAS